MDKLSKKLVIANNTGTLLGAVPSHTHTHARTHIHGEVHRSYKGGKWMGTYGGNHPLGGL